ncbi:uncharacterized protein LOC106509613 [Sus scrofa]|uniref:uncharacterized protein LOC106509613 n=1 Tax=Sus scrofa TaxID=9823 RepID=UPI000A2B74CE|nr:uncharacterized protein LOC106509613 [Sus scrofa]XP_020941637.1 uncharacterized protein LOC106509613 [Sus scrofa]XP_020941639.1 uncharacterized protein LOC106509613 [Sus scrofa]XP_020941640.1 uncharacterized protein LOC106509613 [Sus scrofa]XP_020941641.1 uncharacterized protein LOC106509613 [Sus scrofa]XP_020941642.1 uncharacterized protein LOC106509613 [Sus scrofa]XP_020941643.1 uncharacterized protein LOC106509613 [Sus scrofa]
MTGQGRGVAVVGKGQEGAQVGVLGSEGFLSGWGQAWACVHVAGSDEGQLRKRRAPADSVSSRQPCPPPSVSPACRVGFRLWAIRRTTWTSGAAPFEQNQELKILLQSSTATARLSCVCAGHQRVRLVRERRAGLWAPGKGPAPANGTAGHGQSLQVGVSPEDVTQKPALRAPGEGPQSPRRGHSGRPRQRAAPRRSGSGSSHHGSEEANLTSIHEEAVRPCQSACDPQDAGRRRLFRRQGEDTGTQRPRSGRLSSRRRPLLCPQQGPCKVWRDVVPAPPAGPRRGPGGDPVEGPGGGDPGGDPVGGPEGGQEGTLSYQQPG